MPQQVSGIGADPEIVQFPGIDRDSHPRQLYGLAIRHSSIDYEAAATMATHPISKDPMSESQGLLSSTKSLCVAHQCPSCGTTEQVTAERVVEGNVSVTRCHCRAC